MGGEGGEQPRFAQHGLGAGHITDVGAALAGEHRIVGQAAFLGALDLAVPIGALDQPHHQPPPGRAGHGAGPGDHRRRAALIGLDGHAQAVPTGQGGIARRPFDDVEGYFQPLALLGVDGQADAAGLGGARQLDQLSGQVRCGAGRLERFVTRIERRKLDRHAIGGEHVARSARRASDGGHGVEIGLEIGLGVRVGARALSQHVEGIAKRLVGPAIGAAQGLVDVAAEHEGFAHPLHGPGHRDADRRLAQPPDQGAHGSGLRIGQRLGQDQAHGGAVDQHRVGPAQVRAPVALAELVADQGVGGAGIGHAQIGFGETQKRRALFAGKTVFAQKLIDPAGAAGRPQFRQQSGGLQQHALAFGDAEPGVVGQFS